MPQPRAIASPHTEVTLTGVAVRAGGLALVPAATLAGLLRGWDGALTAAASIGLIVVWITLVGLPLAWAARHGLAALYAAALGGFALRVAGLGLLAVAMQPVRWVDGPVLAVTVAVAMVALLTYEVRYVLSHRELWWLRVPQRTRDTVDVGKEPA